MIRWIVCIVLALTAGLCFDLPTAQARPRRGRGRAAVAVVVPGAARVAGRRPRRARRPRRPRPARFFFIGQAPVIERVETVTC